jgi:alkanesulfonate monooxygenase SsuD/methylene tetrahydromethanopterin reductase-like flavin-dependent oxidoreductase (luciferase family)
VDLGVHLPLLDFAGEGLSRARLIACVDAAREHGFVAVSSNDHFVFSRPWLDGPIALGAVLERAGDMQLATTVALPVLRGPVPLAKALAALDRLSNGRLTAGVGPGSSQRDYELAGIPFEERWKRFDETVQVLRHLVRGEPRPPGLRFYETGEAALEPPPVQAGGVPIWIGSWGSEAGLRRVARLADGWLASAYNTTPELFAAARGDLEEQLRARGRVAHAFPSALATMWTWVTDSRSERERVLGEVLARLLNRSPEDLEHRVCVGSPEDCAELLSRYAGAGCGRVYVWPLGDEPRQLERLALEVRPQLAATRAH